MQYKFNPTITIKKVPSQSKTNIVTEIPLKYKALKYLRGFSFIDNSGTGVHNSILIRSPGSAVPAASRARAQRQPEPGILCARTRPLEAREL